jgi:hypothetical protein
MGEAGPGAVVVVLAAGMDVSGFSPGKCNTHFATSRVGSLPPLALFRPADASAERRL